MGIRITPSILNANLADLNARFEAGATVDLNALKAARLVARAATRVKVLGDGELDRKLTLRVHGISAGARAKVEAAGGTIEILATTKTPAEGSTAT